MSYQILYSKTSEKYLKRLSPSKASNILQKIEILAGNPNAINNNITKLSGTMASYRLRIGNMRVIYELDEQRKIIYVVKIKPRGSAYSM